MDQEVVPSFWIVLSVLGQSNNWLTATKKGSTYVIVITMKMQEYSAKVCT